MAATESYRITQEKVESSSSEEGELSSDDDVRIAVNEPNEGMENIVLQPTMSISTELNAKRKPKNIWSQVLADQSSNDISTGMGTVGMNGCMDRGPESFSVEPFMRRHRDIDSSSSDCEVPAKMSKVESIEEEMENYMIERHFIRQSRKTKPSKSANAAQLKRKRAKKSKSNNFPGSVPGQRIVLNKRLQLSKTDSEDKVAEELIFRLWEKKRDLIKSLVRCIGVERSLFLYNKTEALELNGGLMTLQGNRRRTPGGTFLHLLRTDEEVNQTEINEIFEADYLRDREQWRAVKEAKKQLKKAKADVGRTPHNSPQMETSDIKTIEGEANAMETADA